MVVNPLDVGCLRVFDVVARHGNLSHAAAELRTTQPALSYRVRQMELLLGVTLFLRRHRGLELTAEGEKLGRAVRQGLERLDETVMLIQRQARAPTVRLATDFGFAAARLMPRMTEFRLAHPDIEVQIIATQSVAAALEIDVDLAIIFGAKEDFSSDALLLVPERVTTVCAPGFARRYGPFETPDTLLHVPLIHLHGPNRKRWFEWDNWLTAAGVHDRSALSSISFNTYTLVIQAALAEQGVALGWLGLVDDLTSSGALVRACDITLASERGYWLLRPDRVQTAEVALVAAWLTGPASPG